MVTPTDILNMLQELGVDDISLADDDFITNEKIASIDIIRLIQLAEERYNCVFDANLFDPDNFESCDKIAKVINQSLK